MRVQCLGILCLALSAASPGWADTQFRARKMTRNDVPLGKGQCDIRIAVDGEVEVTVRGDLVTMRTISGRDGRDNGSECNEPLPNRQIEGFRFENIESRGEVRLLSEPSRRSDYQAIVRIRDTNGGEGGYHFRLSWVMTGQVGPDRGRPGDRDDRDGRYDRGARDDHGGLAWNNTFHFGGPGRGSSTLSGYGAQRLADVTVDIDRGGRVLVSFRTDTGRPLTFTGLVINFDRDAIRADVATDDRARLRGSMSLARDGRGDVYRISLDATNGDSRLRLDWDRR